MKSDKGFSVSLCFYEPSFKIEELICVLDISKRIINIFMAAKNRKELKIHVFNQKTCVVSWKTNYKIKCSKKFKSNHSFVI